jgi:hypothetical protein
LCNSKVSFSLLPSISTKSTSTCTSYHLLYGRSNAIRRTSMKRQISKITKDGLLMLLVVGSCDVFVCDRHLDLYIKVCMDMAFHGLWKAVKQNPHNEEEGYCLPASLVLCLIPSSYSLQYDQQAFFIFTRTISCQKRKLIIFLVGH